MDRIPLVVQMMMTVQGVAKKKTQHVVDIIQLVVQMVNYSKFFPKFSRTIVKFSGLLKKKALEIQMESNSKLNWIQKKKKMT